MCEAREDAQEAILLECLRRTREIESPPERNREPGAWPKYGTPEWERQYEYGPAWSAPKWFGRIDEADRRRFGRAVVDLEKQWLIEPYGPGSHRTKRLWEPGGRITNLQLTEEGRRKAEWLERNEPQV